MLSLHDVVDAVKRVFKYGAILVATVISMVIIFKIIGAIKGTPPPPAATVCFGKLPKTLFPLNATEKKLTYSIDTISGNLPVYQSDRIDIYETILPQPNLKVLDNAQEKLSRIGFASRGNVISGSLYKWENASQKIDYDIIYSNFIFTSNFLSDEDVLSGNNKPDETTAISVSQSFLSDLYSFPDIIDTNKTRITLQSIVNNEIVSASDLSAAKIIRVDFYQKDINKIPVFYSHPPFSNINILVTGGKNNAQVSHANYSLNTFNDKPCTYPVKTIQEAYEELKQGNAYIGFYNGNSSNVTIKDAFIAYYMDEKPQKYSIPIFVFKGDNEFFAYVEAIKDEWIDK